MIKFEGITLEGFGCWAKEFNFTLDRPGLNIMAAANGKGKSTIFSAVVWVVFGKSLKAKSEVATWHFKRPLNWRGTKVELFFGKGDDDYHVIRCLDFKGKVEGAVGKNRLLIFKNGEEILSARDKRDSQSLLNGIIGYSFELFTNAVIFPQKAKRFIEESGTDKRKMFEEIFDLGWITLALDKAKVKKKEYEVELAEYNTDLVAVNTEIAGKNEFLDHLAKEASKFKDAKLAEIARIEKGIEVKTLNLKTSPPDSMVLATEIETISMGLVAVKNEVPYIDLDVNKKGMERWDRQYNNCKADIIKTKVDIEHYSTHNTCEVCDSVLTDEKVEILLADAKLTLGTLEVSLGPLRLNTFEYTQLVNRGSKLRKEVFQRTELLNMKSSELRILDSQISDYNLAQEKISGLEASLEKEKATKFNDISPGIRKTLRTLEKEATEIGYDIEDMENSIEQLNWVISNPLSPAGLKSYIINTMIEYLNQRLLHYQKFIKFEIKLLVDMDLARKDIRTIVELEGNPVLFEDLSGGEKQLIYIALAFGLADLLQDKNSTNIAVFDELFESLDVMNTEVISDLLQDRTEGGSSIYVITHKQDFALRNSNQIEI